MNEIADPPPSRLFIKDVGDPFEKQLCVAACSIPGMDDPDTIAQREFDGIFIRRDDQTRQHHLTLGYEPRPGSTVQITDGDVVISNLQMSHLPAMRASEVQQVMLRPTG